MSRRTAVRKCAFVRMLRGDPVGLARGALLTLNDAVQLVSEPLLLLLYAGAEEHVRKYAADSETYNEGGKNGNSDRHSKLHGRGSPPNTTRPAYIDCFNDEKIWE